MLFVVFPFLLLIFYVCLQLLSVWLVCVLMYSSWVYHALDMFGKFSAVISSNVFSSPFSLSPSGTPIMQVLVHLMLSQRSLRLSSLLFSLFFFPIFCGSDFHHSVLQLIYLFCLLFCYWFLLVYYSPLFVCSLVLLGLCKHFLCLLNLASIVSLRSWIIFTIIILNSFSGKLPISSLFSFFFFLRLYLVPSSGT